MPTEKHSVLQGKIRERLDLFERNINDFLGRVPFSLDSERNMEEFLQGERERSRVKRASQAERKIFRTTC